MVDLVSSAAEHGGLAGMPTSLQFVPVPGFGDLADAIGATDCPRSSSARRGPRVDLPPRTGSP